MIRYRPTKWNRCGSALL